MWRQWKAESERPVPVETPVSTLALAESIAKLEAVRQWARSSGPQLRQARQSLVGVDASVAGAGAERLIWMQVADRVFNLSAPDATSAAHLPLAPWQLATALDDAIAAVDKIEAMFPNQAIDPVNAADEYWERGRSKRDKPLVLIKWDSDNGVTERWECDCKRGLVKSGRKCKNHNGPTSTKIKPSMLELAKAFGIDGLNPMKALEQRRTRRRK